MCSLASKPPAGKATDDLIDLREQLWNEGLTGPACLIQVPTERITRLRGILLDLDPAKLIAENPWFPPADDPVEFHAKIKHVLQRHPLARHAEIRLSGTGLHGIIRLAPPVELTSAGEQKNWANLTRMAQCSLPVDFNAPGITARLGRLARPPPRSGPSSRCSSRASRSTPRASSRSRMGWSRRHSGPWRRSCWALNISSHVRSAGAMRPTSTSSIAWASATATAAASH